MGTTLERVDGGYACGFADGPKQGQVGVVNPEPDGAPPKHLVFLDGSLVYDNPRRRMIKAADDQGRPRRYDGVVYSMAKDCPFAREIAKVDAEALAQREVLEA